MSTFNMDELNKAIARMTPKEWSSYELDEFMKETKDIENVMLVTPLEDMKDMEWVQTKYGRLKVRYSRFIEPDKAYFVRIPEPIYGYGTKLKL